MTNRPPSTTHRKPPPNPWLKIKEQAHVIEQLQAVIERANGRATGASDLRFRISLYAQLCSYYVELTRELSRPWLFRNSGTIAALRAATGEMQDRLASGAALTAHSYNAPQLQPNGQKNTRSGLFG